MGCHRLVGMLALDNPVYSSLETGHAHLALSHGAAKRYPAEVAPFAGLREVSAAAFADLEVLVAPGEIVALVTAAAVELPEGWELVRGALHRSDGLRTRRPRRPTERRHRCSSSATPTCPRCWPSRS